MRFALIDRIVSLEPGSRIAAVKSPSLTEEYLHDHFPLFPVMPGVLMLESMYQAAAWLLRVTDNFALSVILLKEAKNVKYSGFVRPGEKLEVTAEIVKREDRLTVLKASGRLGETSVAAARLVIESTNLADQAAVNSTIDEIIRQRLRRELLSLYHDLRNGNGIRR